MTYEPKSEHRFTFGLWTVGNPGIDPFGEPVRSRPRNSWSSSQGWGRGA